MALVLEIKHKIIESLHKIAKRFIKMPRDDMEVVILTEHKWSILAALSQLVRLSSS